ncbi:BACON domain-containing protein [Alistipes sp. An66]|uniref:BACON domain-containing protein n=1 Tax=Alistipes sp. An66 TaxID=1965650 RepID=UPI000B371458|nr:BACON domain-containing carbohydrate-binding protein [Alistipes sp. An66]OUN55973.1 hypothetical protein B5G16_11825 [Alistipes sp. An66]
MKRLLILLQIVALIACTKDKTANMESPCIGDIQFAAAIDPPTNESRVIENGGNPIWNAGDQIGITALIDGTPYIENIPYMLEETSSFSILTPGETSIRWNESVVGLRTFLAYYPYETTNIGGALNRAIVHFNIPAQQQIVAGTNLTQPFLLGEAETSASQQKPVALRFKYFSSILELQFEPFKETSIKTIEIGPAENSTLNGWLAAKGSIDNFGVIALSEQSDRITIECDDFNLDKVRNIRIPIGHFTTDESGLLIKITTDDNRIFRENLFVGSLFSSYETDDSGQFLAAKHITHTMKMEVISDETDQIYFEDNFDWITSSDRWSNFTGGGWPTVSAETSVTGKSNGFSLDLLEDFSRIGYSVSSNYRTCVQARYEGYVCLGISSKRAALTTPKLNEIGTEPTDLLVSFYGASYASATMTPDTQPFVLAVDGPGTIDDTGSKNIEISITNCFRWKKYWIIVKGATDQTRIVFGKDEALPNARILIDNILIGKALKGAIAGSRDIQTTIEPEIWLLNGDNAAIENLEGAETSLIVQATTSWSAVCDVDWLTFTPTNEGLGTGIAYKLVFHALSQNTSEASRKATIIISAADQVSKTITIVQDNQIPETVFLEDDFDWTIGDGTNGGILNGPLTNATTIGTNGTKYTSWNESYKQHGWTSESGYLYAKNGILGFGTTSAVGDMVSPFLEEIGPSATDILVEYDILEYKNAKETGKSIFAILGDGRIVSIEGNYTGISTDSYTGISTDGKQCNYYCGDYGDWSNGAQWHHIIIRIEEATSQTRIKLLGDGGYSRFWIDNLKIKPCD